MKTVDLLVSRPGARLSTPRSPIQVGIPLPEGALFDPTRVRLRDSHNNAVPVQTKVLGLWRKLSDAANAGTKRSIKWLQGAFEVQHDERMYHFDYGVDPMPVGDAQPRVTVACTVDDRSVAWDTANVDHVTVDTGAIQFEVERAFPTLVSRVRVAEMEVTSGTGHQGLYLTRAGVDHTTYRAALDPNATLTVEEAGPCQTTLRATGHYVNDCGDRLNRWDVRIKAYAGKSFIRVFHTIIFTEAASDTNRYSDIGVEISLAEDTDRSLTFARGEAYQVAAELPEQVYYDVSATAFRFSAAELAGHSHLFLNQTTHRDYAVYESGVPVQLGGQQVKGERSGHWFGLRGTRFAFTAAVRWLWQNHPMGLEWRAPGVMRIHLWSLEGARKPGEPPRALDFRPQQYLESRGRWSVFEREVRAYSDRLKARHEYPSQTSVSAPCEGSTADQVAGTMYATGIGVSKTHEFTLEFAASTASSQELMPETAYLLQRPVVVHADPVSLRKSLAMGPLQERNPAERFPEAEKAIDLYLERFYLEQANDRANPAWYDVRMEIPSNRPGDMSYWGDSYGAFDFGDTLHTGKHFHRYWSHLFYVEPSVWWILYARSGDRRLLEFAEANARHHMDIDTTHVDFMRVDASRRTICSEERSAETSRLVRAGARNHDDSGAIHWANVFDNLNVTNHVASYLASYYYLTGYERARDVAREIKRAIEADPGNRSELIGSRELANREIGAALWAVVDLYALLHDDPTPTSAPAPLATVARALADRLTRDVVGSLLRCAVPGTENLAVGYSAGPDGEREPLDFTLAYTFPAAIAHVEIEDDRRLAESMKKWVHDQAQFIAANNLHRFQNTRFNQWRGMAQAFEWSRQADLLSVPAAELEVISQHGFEDVSWRLDHRVHWMHGVGYLLHGLASASPVVPRMELETTAGEIQIKTGAGLFVKVMAQRSHPEVLDATARLVLYDSIGHPLISRAHPAAGPGATKHDIWWFNVGGWIETFDVPDAAAGIYRLRVETRAEGKTPFVITLLENRTGSAMFAAGTGDGVSPGGPYPRRRRYWCAVPAGVSGFECVFQPEKSSGAYEFKFRVSDRDGNSAQISYMGNDVIGAVDVGTPANPAGEWRAATIRRGAAVGEVWAVEIGPVYDHYAQGTVKRAHSRELRTFRLNGIPRYFALSESSVFAPRVLWPPILVGVSQSRDRRGEVTLRWQAEVGADRYTITLSDVNRDRPLTFPAAIGGGRPGLTQAEAGCEHGTGVCTYVLPKVLDPGEYEFTVTALSDVPGERAAHASLPMRFTVG